MPADESDPRRCGQSRDRRGDCVQVVVAPVVTPEGLPLAYGMIPGNAADRSMLHGMMDMIRSRDGSAEWIRVMDRGIPTEELLTELREGNETPARYLVGTPKRRLARYEADLESQSWKEVRPRLRVKLLPKGGEVSVLAEVGIDSTRSA